MSLEEEIKQLYDLLDAEELTPLASMSGLPQFSAEAKNALVAQVVRTFTPPPSGRLLSRLLLISTAENRDDLVTAYLANLRSPDSLARRASLYGLAGLDYPGFADLAIMSLRDEADAVLAAACDVLVQRAQQDARVMKMLQDVYTLYKDNPQYHMTVSLLQAHQIGE